MKKLGIIGGTSWHSTAIYYNHINRAVAKRLGGLHSATLVIESLDFAVLAELQRSGDWEGANAMVVAAAERLAGAGADGLLLASNAMHRATGAVASATGLDIVDIREATAAKLEADGATRIALLGTRPTMTEGFARGPYEDKGIVIQKLAEPWIAEVDRIIYEELGLGQVVRESQRKLRTLFTELAKQRVQGVVLACTELAMAIDVRANLLPVYDTTAIHARAAVEWMLDEGEKAEDAVRDAA